MPNVTRSALPPPKCAGVFGTELPAPQSDDVVADYDSALSEEIFNISEAQPESVIEPKWHG
jgi:hypothetical protein